MNHNYTECTTCQKQFTGIECYRQHIESQKHKKRAQLCELNSDRLSQEEFICKICLMNFTGCIPYEQHLKSERHFKKCKSSDCLEVDRNINSNSSIELNQSKTVSSNVGFRKEINSCYEGSNKESTLLQLPSQYFMCEVCNLYCTGHIPYEQHLKSEKHFKKLKLNEYPNVDVNIIGSFSNGLNQNKVASMNIDVIKVDGHPEASNSEQNFFHQLSPEQFFCKICNIYCTGCIPYEQHLKSEKHFKKLKLNDCLKVFTNVSEKSNNDLDQNDVVLTNTDIEEVNRFSKDKSSNKLYCDLCNKHFTGPECAKQHYEGKNHQKEVSRKSEKYQSNNFESDDRNFTTIPLFEQNVKLICADELFKL